MGLWACGGESGRLGDEAEARRGLLPSSCEFDLGLEEDMVKEPVPDEDFLCVCAGCLLLLDEERVDMSATGRRHVFLFSSHPSGAQGGIRASAGPYELYA